MKSKKTSKTTRARKPTKDLPLAGRATAGKVAGGKDLRAMVVKVEENMAQKDLLRKAQKAIETM